MDYIKIENGLLTARADQFNIRVTELDDRVVVILEEKKNNISLIEQLKRPKKVVDNSE